MNARKANTRYRSIKTNVLLTLLSITIVAVFALAIIAVNSTQTQGQNAQKISSEALTTQAKEYLLQLTQSSAKENDTMLERVQKDAEQLADYTAAIFNNPQAFSTRNFWEVEDHLFTAEEGQLMNGEEDISSVLIPNTRVLDNALIRDVELSAYLDLMFESILKSSQNTEAIYFATPRDMTRYYPNIGLGALVPPDFQASQRVWFTGSTLENNPGRGAWWTPVYVDATGLGLITTAAVPVYDKQQNLIGVVGFDITLKDMVANIEATRLLQTGYSFLIDKTGHAIALPDLGYQHILGRQPEESEINTDLTTSMTGFAPILANMMNGRSGVDSLVVNGEELLVAYAPLESASWSMGSVVQSKNVLRSVAILQEELEETTSSLLLTRILPVSAIILFFVILVGIMMTNRVVNPIQKLVVAAQQLQSGKWDMELPVTSNNEIGVLAQAFKAMAAQLFEMVRGLEERVQERTRDLERRSSQIQVAAEISRDATSAHRLEILLNRAVELVRERFGYYHAGIFLLDAKGEYAVLQAATGEAGKAMLEANHKLKVGEVGIVGYVTAAGRPRISLDVGADAVHFKNPYLPDTRSEMALPLKVGLNVIGALDVQSEKPTAFDQDDITILQVMADQLAVAIENARLLEEAQENLQQLQALYGLYNKEAWHRLESANNVIGFQYDSAGITPILKSTAIHSEGSSPALNSPEISMPLEVRGQVIGTLDIWHEPDAWTEEETTIVKAVAERVSQAMESARLFEETQARVAREQTLNQLVASFTHSLDFDTLLRTAVREMGRLPNVSEISIHVGPPENVTSTNNGNNSTQSINSNGGVSE